MGLREANKRALRQRILGVCGELFRARGFDDTSIDDIIERAGISRQTFFNYFGGKDAALTELGLEWLQAQAELPPPDPDPFGPVPVLEAARHVVIQQARAIEADRDFMALVLTRSDLFSPRLATGSPLARARTVDRTRQIFEGVARVIRAGQAAGEIRSDADPLQAAEVYVSVMIMTIRLWLADHRDTGQSLESRIHASIDLVEHGLRAPTPPPGAGEGKSQGKSQGEGKSQGKSQGAGEGRGWMTR